jgi:hypothetical protein
MMLTGIMAAIRRQPRARSAALEYVYFENTTWRKIIYASRFTQSYDGSDMIEACTGAPGIAVDGSCVLQNVQRVSSLRAGAMVMLTIGCDALTAALRSAR